jgi:type II secretory pathway component PulM
MNAISEKLHSAVEPLRTQFNRLSSRERSIVLLMGIGFTCLLAVGILVWVGSSSSSWQKKVASSRKNISTIVELGSNYQRLEANVSRLDEMISRVPRDFGLATELEKIASANSLQIDSIKDRKGPPHEFYEENQVILSLKDVEIRTLIDFLQSVENSNRFMLISDLVIKPGFKDPTKLSVQTVISTFQPLEPNS